MVVVLVVVAAVTLLIAAVVLTDSQSLKKLPPLEHAAEILKVMLQMKTEFLKKLVLNGLK